MPAALIFIVATGSLARPMLASATFRFMTILTFFSILFISTTIWRVGTAVPMPSPAALGLASSLVAIFLTLGSVTFRRARAFVITSPTLALAFTPVPPIILVVGICSRLIKQVLRRLLAPILRICRSSVGSFALGPGRGRLDQCIARALAAHPRLVKLVLDVLRPLPVADLLGCIEAYHTAHVALIDCYKLLSGWIPGVHLPWSRVCIRHLNGRWALVI